MGVLIGDKLWPPVTQGAPMDFDDTPAEAAFRSAARSWLEENWTGNAGGSSAAAEADVLANAKVWQHQLYDGGWACIGWPKAYGGRDATPIERVIWSQELARHPGAGANVFVIGQGMCAPTLMAFASEGQKAQHLPRIARGDDVWCQLFSEPVAGSDLAGIRTRAVRDGDDWVINGQKVWTSGAHYSDYGIVITRTDPTVPKHRGLTMFFLSMKSPGIEIRPIKQANGDHSFNEVFFRDVRVSDAQRLGEVGKGWEVSLVTLLNERVAVGGALASGTEALVAMARQANVDGAPALDNPAVRHRIADWYAQLAGLKFTGFRMLSAMSRGQTPGPEASISKVVVARCNQQIADLALDLAHEGGILDDNAATAAFMRQFLRSPANRIEGGSDEILRNIIAERVLGLPADIRADKGLPFDQIPTASSKAR